MQEPTFSISAFTLFDDVLSDDLYRHLKLQAKDQNFLKEKRLAEAVNEIETDLLQTVGSLNSLDVLGSFRKSFMKAINRPLSMAIVKPFLSRRLVDRVDEIFVAVEQFLRATGLTSLAAFLKANEILEAFARDAEQYGTKYARTFLAGPAKRIEELVRLRFSESPMGKPAKLTVEKSEKKYPFHMQGPSFNVSFILRNEGPGHAFDVYFRLLEATDLEVTKAETYLGTIEPTSLVLEVPVVSKATASDVAALVELRWNNFDGTSRREEFLLGLDRQRADVDWKALAMAAPYSLEPVETESELVGRREILEQLMAQARAPSLGSSYVSGQKRIGKTSIVKTLKTRLKTECPTDFLVLYFERGDYGCPDAPSTVAALGRRICQGIRSADARFRNLPVPAFSDALSPLTEFLESVIELAPAYRILIILDEFDELPLQLYKGEPVGNAFFGTIRSISGKPPFAFILVGAENMEYVMSFQGSALNKFRSIPLDYFDREQHWSDFQELVRRPVREWLEVSDDALIALYEQTAGNPFFTKLICARLCQIMIERRDCHATRQEITQATREVIKNDLASNKVQHFWTDGILETGVRHEDISIRRRKVLLCLTEAFRQQGLADRASLIKLGESSYGIDAPSVETELREFQRRGIVVSKGTSYDFKVPLFREWLKEKGVVEIITSFSNLDAFLQHKRKEEELRLKPEDIEGVLERWGIYRGHAITEAKVRKWLSQFGDSSSQRLMFELLRHLRFYSSHTMRAKLQEAHGMVLRGITRRSYGESRKRPDILVSYIDGPGKSGAYYAKLYADENGIYYENVVEKGRIGKALSENQNLQCLVFVDDFLGTGNSASAHFRDLAAAHGPAIAKAKLSLFFIVICGFEAGQIRLDATLNELNLIVRAQICDILDESHRCFGDRSLMFPDPAVRNNARQIAYFHGARLETHIPLGFSDCQAAVVFENNCPNNSLPILWSGSNDWIPLFERI